MATDPELPVGETPDSVELNSVLRRNIQALQKKRTTEEAAVTGEERIAATVSRFAGSMMFVYLNAAILIAWICVNVGLVPIVHPFDPTFVILATGASVEAIFLSTFILISQNRAAVLADRRSDLDVQISLLTEHEVTRVLSLCTEIAASLDLKVARDPRLEELRQDVAPERVLDEIAGAQNPPER